MLPGSVAAQILDAVLEDDVELDARMQALEAAKVHHQPAVTIGHRKLNGPMQCLAQGGGLMCGGERVYVICKFCL